MCDILCLVMGFAVCGMICVMFKWCLAVPDILYDGCDFCKEFPVRDMICVIFSRLSQL